LECRQPRRLEPFARFDEAQAFAQYFARVWCRPDATSALMMSS
jgi:hypothetical protein